MSLHQLQIAIAEHLKDRPADLAQIIGAAVAGISSAVDRANERANNQATIANCALLLLDGKRMSLKTREMIYENMARAIGDGDGTPIQNKFKGVSA